VTASGFVVDRSRSRLVLIHHRNLGRWLQPGGHVDESDPSVLDAAIREVAEETGLVTEPIGTGLFDVDVHDIPPSRDRPAHKHYDMRFLLQATGEDLVAADEVLGVRWVAFAEVPLLHTDASVLRVLAKIESMVSGS
jgi:8-oxo-dGTP pyrophosphatase MutT (NUDIX family)